MAGTELTVEHDDLVCSVHIQTLVQREREGIVVKGCVSRGVMALDGGMRESSNKLLDVADTQNFAEWRPKRGIVPEVQVHSGIQSGSAEVASEMQRGNHA